MILDELSQAGKYYVLHPRFKTAFDFLINNNLEELSLGKHIIEGEDVFAIIVNEDGVAMLDSTAEFECHNTYIDIQYVFGGVETIGYKHRDTCVEPRGAYNQEKDVLFFEDAPDFFFKLSPGQFGIYFPTDVHAPMIGEGKIRKVVLKVRVK